ncbi:MAG: hypothetical protein KY468_07200 [Armatimonadetes bacterium]|nr:hypothetical protein [Armatimonadota bacterium]
MRGRRFLGVFLKSGLFFGLLFGLLGGGLTAMLLSAFLSSRGIPLLPLWMLIPLMVIATGAPMGLLMAVADATMTRSTPEDRLDPSGAVRQRITLEVPLPPEAALEAVSRIVFEELGWAIEKRETGHLTLRTPASFRSFGEQVMVDLHPTPDGSAVLLYSRPLSFLVTVDYNKNRENVLRFRELLLERLGRVQRDGPSDEE